MSWIWLAGVAAVCYALQGAWTKRLTRIVTREAATWAIFAFAFPILALYLAARGLPSVEPVFWLVVGANVVLYVVSFRLYVSALEVGDLGLTYPLLALTPVLVVPVEWTLLGDRIEVTGLVGIAAVATGVYLLNLRREQGSLLDPLRGLAGDPGCRRMMGVAVIWSVSGTLDRVAVLNASPSLYGAAVSLALGLVLLPAALRSLGREGEGGADAPPPSRVRRAGALSIQGLLFAVMFVAQMEALRLSLAANVITVKRSGTLLTVLMGGLLFRERGLARRLLATAVLLGGVYLVATS